MPLSRKRTGDGLPQLKQIPAGKEMSWATNYIKQLLNGETVQFRPRGGSMKVRLILVNWLPFDHVLQASL